MVGVLTGATWWRRADEQEASTRAMTLIARGGLVVATVVGLAFAGREVAGVLGAG